MGQGPRFWVSAVAGGLAATLGALTAVWPDWIELLTGTDPDGGNGGLEWIAVGVLLVVAVLLVRRARVAWRGAAEREAGGARSA
jgi:hypothetical protein